MNVLRYQIGREKRKRKEKETMKNKEKKNKEKTFKYSTNTKRLSSSKVNANMNRKFSVEKVLEGKPKVLEVAFSFNFYCCKYIIVNK